MASSSVCAAAGIASTDASSAAATPPCRPTDPSAMEIRRGEIGHADEFDPRAAEIEEGASADERLVRLEVAPAETVPGGQDEVAGSVEPSDDVEAADALLELEGDAAGAGVVHKGRAGPADERVLAKPAGHNGRAGAAGRLLGAGGRPFVREHGKTAAGNHGGTAEGGDLIGPCAGADRILAAGADEHVAVAGPDHVRPGT